MEENITQSPEERKGGSPIRFITNNYTLILNVVVFLALIYWVNVGVRGLNVQNEVNAELTAHNQRGEEEDFLNFKATPVTVLYDYGKVHKSVQSSLQFLSEADLSNANDRLLRLESFDGMLRGRKQRLREINLSLIEDELSRAELSELRRIQLLVYSLLRLQIQKEILADGQVSQPEVRAFLSLAEEKCQALSGRLAIFADNAGILGDEFESEEMGRYIVGGTGLQ